METMQVGSDRITFRVTSEESGGALLAAEVEMPAGGGPPVMHRHVASEVYRVEEGELAIYVEESGGGVRRIRATPGSVVHIAGGRAHTIRNESEAGARAYVTFVPGARLERFVRAAARLAADGPPAMAEVLALAERHGVEMTGPVPGAEGAGDRGA
jgi:mannose-6-phosphate isomerase-like protein (cupin superfamily)